MGKDSDKRIALYMVVILGMAIVSSGAKEKIGERDEVIEDDGISDIPGHDEKIFNVLDFDAIADGKTDNQEMKQSGPYIKQRYNTLAEPQGLYQAYLLTLTGSHRPILHPIKALMEAYRAACDHPGKARLLIPGGKVFAVSQVPFVGPCKGPGPIVVQIEGNLSAVTDVSLYEEPEWLIFERHQGLVVLGGGVVDGNGANVWKYNDCSKKASCARFSSSLVFKNVSNGSIRRITSLNPMGFHIFITRCRNMRLQRLLIRAPGDSPNTDGVHISSSDHIKLAQLHIETGDDCVGILQGSTEVAVNKVFCGPGHGISIGSLGKHEDEEDVRGIRVRNCTLRNTENGLRIKTFPFKPKVKAIQATQLVFTDIIMENVKNPILIDQEYCGVGHSCVNAASKIKLSDIFFQNVRGTTISPEAISIRCSSAQPCQNIHLHDINIKGVKGQATGSCSNAKLNVLGLQIPPVKC